MTNYLLTLRTMIKFTTETKMIEFANNLALALTAAFNHGGLVFLRGQLGAGKTALVRGILRGLGYTGTIKSPTYGLVESYQLTQGLVHHFDLYRIENKEQLVNVDFEEFFTAKAICFIEWPQHGGHLLPQPDIEFELHIESDGRRLDWIANTPLGRDMLNAAMVSQ